MKIKKLTKKLKFSGKALEFIQSQAEMTILLASRGFGKSVAAGYLAAKKLTSGHSGVIMSPTYRDVEGQLLRNTLKVLDSYGYVEKKHYFLDKKGAELVLMNKNGTVKATCFWRSAEDPECTRGITEVDWVVMDEAAKCKREAFDILLPVLRGEGITDTQTYLITSPRGIGNWVSELYGHDDVNALHGSVYDCAWMTEEQREKFIDRHRKRYSDLFFRQEILGEIIDVSADSVYSSQNLDMLYSIQEHKAGELVAGLDIGRKGDPCCLAIRNGNRIVHVEKQFDMLTISELKGWLLRVLSKYPHLKRMYIDETGLGQYVPAELQNRFPSCEFIGINFGSKERKRGYKLVRSEIFFDLKRHIEDHGLHFDPMLSKDIIQESRTELCAIEYSVDDKSRLAVCSKDSVKDRLGHSCDIADALALMCHDSRTVSKEKIQSVVKHLSKPRKAYPNKKG